jgi:hypothetical protein
MLVDATRMAQPLPEPSPTAAPLHTNGSRRGAGSSMSRRAVMFLALDFEWWERSEDVILEVGWSLWDSLTQQHRSRHWVIKEHLNKVRLPAASWHSNALHLNGTFTEDLGAACNGGCFVASRTYCTSPCAPHAPS